MHRPEPAGRAPRLRSGLEPTMLATDSEMREAMP